MKETEVGCQYREMQYSMDEAEKGVDIRISTFHAQHVNPQIQIIEFHNPNMTCMSPLMVMGLGIPIPT